jgi:pre-rRNA-processing protein IPI3
MCHMLFLARDGMKGQLIDTETQTILRNYAVGEVARNALAYSPVSQAVIAHQARSCALFLSPTTQQPLQRSFTPELITSCAVTGCGTFMVAGTANGTVLLWNLISGELIKNYKGHLRCIQCVAISADDSLVATASEDSVCKVWNLSTLASLRVREVVPRCVFTGHSLSVNCCLFLRQAHVLVTGSADRTCRLIDVRSGEQLHFIAVGDAVTALTVSPDDRSLVAGTQKGFLYFCELYAVAYGLPVAHDDVGSRREPILRPPSADGHHSPVVFIASDPAMASLVLTASEGGAVLWYDMRSGRLVKECVAPQKGRLLSCCFVPSTALYVKGACAPLEKNPVDPTMGNYHVTHQTVVPRGSAKRGEKRPRGTQSDEGSRKGAPCEAADEDSVDAKLQALRTKSAELEGLRARLQRQVQRLTSATAATIAN